MNRDRLPMSVDLVSPDAAATLKLRADLEEMWNRGDPLGITLGRANETILHGPGEEELERLVDYLRRHQNHAFKTGAPQVAYRESIKRTTEGDYTFRKQGGGIGQYAKVKIRFAPGEAGSGFSFTDASRGMVPERFLPAIAEGLREAAEHGPVAGFPVIDLACTLVDGGYHEIDSTIDTFETAARACLRETLPKARPRLLEPVMLVVVLTPQDFMGDVIGDLMSRRAAVPAMETYGAGLLITTMVPLANLFGYGPALRQMTRAHARHLMRFDHYEQAPPPGPGDDDPFAPAAALR